MVFVVMPTMSIGNPSAEQQEKEDPTAQTSENNGDFAYLVSPPFLCTSKNNGSVNPSNQQLNYSKYLLNPTVVLLVPFNLKM